jgi:hypothetical protein
MGSGPPVAVRVPRRAPYVAQVVPSQGAAPHRLLPDTSGLERGLVCTALRGGSRLAALRLLGRGVMRAGGTGCCSDSERRRKRRKCH